MTDHPNLYENTNTVTTKSDLQTLALKLIAVHLGHDNVQLNRIDVDGSTIAVAYVAGSGNKRQRVLRFILGG